MKNLLLFIILTGFATALYSQDSGYTDMKEAIDGVEISYKIVHEVASDVTSPAELRLKFKNTNDYAVNITFQLGYSSGMAQDTEGEVMSICINKNANKMGKIDGLNFEFPEEHARYLEIHKAKWNFLTFEVEEVEKCLGNGASKN